MAESFSNSSHSKNKVTVIVVTCNRLQLLKGNIQSLLDQTLQPDNILIVDNNSSDGTSSYLKSIQQNNQNINFITLSENIGGAGGFALGMEYACKHYPGWVWLMDDDALPEPDSLEKISQYLQTETDVYGSVAIDQEENSDSLCWPIKSIQNNSTVQFHCSMELPELLQTTFQPFLGFMIHTSLINKIGLPRKDFFISCDDVEYSLRAIKHGSKIILVSKSIINHPLPERETITVLGKTFNVLSLPPWKRYYNTRNRILLARQHYPLKLYTETLPGIFIRLIFVLLYESQRIQQLKSFTSGVIDGLLNRSGVRWEPGK